MSMKPHIYIGPAAICHNGPRWPDVAEAINERLYNTNFNGQEPGEPALWVPNVEYRSAQASQLGGFSEGETGIVYLDELDIEIRLFEEDFAAELAQLRELYESVTVRFVVNSEWV